MATFDLGSGYRFQIGHEGKGRDPLRCDSEYWETVVGDAGTFTVLGERYIDGSKCIVGWSGYGKARIYVAALAHLVTVAP